MLPPEIGLESFGKVLGKTCHASFHIYGDHVYSAVSISLSPLTEQVGNACNVSFHPVQVMFGWVSEVPLVNKQCMLCGFHKSGTKYFDLSVLLQAELHFLQGDPAVFCPFIFWQSHRYFVDS